MHVIDWILLAAPLLIVLGIGWYTNRYVNSVADFLSGGRLAGRYLLAVARGEMQAGAVTFVAAFEVISKSGLTLTWWGWMNSPFWVIIGISGFVIYRYRETKAMTLAQFFEIRYSKSFRLAAGVLGFLSGIANFGIIPAVGARFFVYFIGLPVTVNIFSHAVPTYVLLMAGFLTISLTMTLLGGLVTLMITNCVEGIISQIFYLVIIFSLVSIFSWSQINDILTHHIVGHTLVARDAGQSLINPFNSMGLKDFNLAFTLMGMFLGLYGTMAWQYQSAYNSASITAHESRMGGILASWRGAGKGALVVLLGLCAMTYLQHPAFAVQAASAHAEIAAIPAHQIQEQMEIPVALSHLLPAGVKGVLCAILLMGLFSGDSTHLHSWGSIFVQDILVPLRKKPFGSRQHIFILRLSIIGVAVFAFLFGSLIRQTDYIVMWWAVSAAVFVGGAGAAIIGGLYWKKGTTAGAWTALIVGSLLSGGGIGAKQFEGYHIGSLTKEFYLNHLGAIPGGLASMGNAATVSYSHLIGLNGTQISFYASLIAVALYIVVSLLTCKKDFNMDRMLHRGEYADPTTPEDGVAAPAKQKVTWGRLIGLDENFTKGDKWVAGSLFGWNMLWFVVFAVGSLWNLVSPWPESAWSMFWHISAIGLPVVISVVTAVWFTWGGVLDIRELFRRLGLEKVNHLDDGTVVAHRNLGDKV
ncbi:MAG: hypothetical protein WCD79_21730 [Chthoniobacteraceae bacterium]